MKESNPMWDLQPLRHPIIRLPNRMRKYSEPPINAAPGIVKIQAHTICRVTPQRTAESRLAAPTPEMDPVMTCVVLTGTPA